MKDGLLSADHTHDVMVSGGIDTLSGIIVLDRAAGVAIPEFGWELVPQEQWLDLGDLHEAPPCVSVPTRVQRSPKPVAERIESLLP